MQRIRSVTLGWMVGFFMIGLVDNVKAENVPPTSHEVTPEKFAVPAPQEELVALPPLEVGAASGEVNWPVLATANLPLLPVSKLAPPLETVQAGSEDGTLEVVVADGEKQPEKKKGNKAKEKKPPKKIEFTGTYRLRYESKQNFDMIYDRGSVQPGQHDDDDNYLLSQLRLNLDLRPNKYIQGHITFQDARETGSHQLDIDALDTTYRNSYQNEADIYEAWIKLKLGEAPLWIQAGRQELIYGDKRFLGNSAWPNTGRSFDAFRLIYEEGDAKLDLIAANRVLVDSNGWDHADHHDNLFAAYGTVKNLPQGLQDVYLFYRDSDVIPLEEYTLGTRIKGDEGNLDWNLEGAYQWGTSRDSVKPFLDSAADLDQEAWAVHAEFGYTEKKHPLKPRVALEYNFATGDENPNDGKNNSFDQLFPNNHSWLGFMDFFPWKNMHSSAVKVSWEQTKKLKFFTEWNVFWLDEESTDAWYNSSQRAFRNAAGKDVSSFVGHELDLRATYKISEKTDLDVGYGHFFAGDYAADTAPVGGGGDDADFVYVQTTWKF